MEFHDHVFRAMTPEDRIQYAKAVLKWLAGKGMGIKAIQKKTGLSKDSIRKALQ